MELVEPVTMTGRLHHVELWVDSLATAAAEHGWTLMFAEQHPWAGGPDHFAAYLCNEAGFEVELVADD